MKPARQARQGSWFVELVRLAVVVFFVGVGTTTARLIAPADAVLGPFNGTVVGALLGSAVGYVVGGVLGRTTLRSVEHTETTLRDVTAEELVAGATGSVGAVVLAALVAWPLFFLPDLLLSFPLFLFVLVTMALLGYRVGRAKRAEVLPMLGARSSLTQRPTGGDTLVVDTSAAVDGRLVEVVRSGFLTGRLLVLSATLDELEAMLRSTDVVLADRGRRGLRTLEKLRAEATVTLDVVAATAGETSVDAANRPGRALVTSDVPTAKAAALVGVRVMDVHLLSSALRPLVLAGDEVAVQLLKAGKEAGQAVGYLDDGTMVVASASRDRIGSEVTVRVSSVITNAHGRMVFGDPLKESTGPVPAQVRAGGRPVPPAAGVRPTTPVAS